MSWPPFLAAALGIFISLFLTFLFIQLLAGVPVGVGREASVCVCVCELGRLVVTGTFLMEG